MSKVLANVEIREYHSTSAKIFHAQAPNAIIIKWFASEDCAGALQQELGIQRSCVSTGAAYTAAYTSDPYKQSIEATYTNGSIRPLGKQLTSSSDSHRIT